MPSPGDLAGWTLGTRWALNGNLCTAVLPALLHGLGNSRIAGGGRFREHAAEEQAHAERLAGRIVQLGGEPDLSPNRLLTRSHSEYIEGDSLIEMIREDLVAERIAIESYTEMIRYLGVEDPTTWRMLEEILANEEEHAEDMKSPLDALDR